MSNTKAEAVKIKSLGEAAQFYVANANKVKDADRSRIQSNVSKLTRWLGSDRDLSGITPSEIGAFSDEQYASTADPSYETMRNIKAFLAFLKKTGWVEKSLSNHLRLAKSSQKTQKRSRVERREIKLTKEGYEELQQQLRGLQSDKLRLTGDIRRAAADGDFRENSPLDAAREEHGRVGRRINEIEGTLRFAVVIEPRGKGRVVAMGTKIHLRDLEDNSIAKYQIVESDEANPFRGKISKDSPIGLAIMNRLLGVKVEVMTPSGPRNYKIESVS